MRTKGKMKVQDHSGVPSSGKKVKGRVRMVVVDGILIKNKKETVETWMGK